jgi:hypothetical protein
MLFYEQLYPNPAKANSNNNSNNNSTVITHQLT